MSNGLAKAVLNRYFSIVQAKEVPYFKLLRKIGCKKSENLEEMWKEHEREIEIFRKEKTNGFKNLRNRKNAEFSLLDLKYEIAKETLKKCVFCERRCRVNRAEGQKGWCRVGA